MAEFEALVPYGGRHAEPAKHLAWSECEEAKQMCRYAQDPSGLEVRQDDASQRLHFKFSQYRPRLSGFDHGTYSWQQKQ